MTDPQDRLTTALADRYRVERQLGQGGMATVYLAHDLKHDRKVAIKVLKPELAAVLGAERFVVEIRTTAALQHPHILPLFDSGTADGFLYYVMPFIDGETLRTKLDRETQLGVDEAVHIAGDVAGALHYAHTHGVIHRDIKPENILLHDGRPMVADFGIALAVSAAAGGRMTETGLSLGTPHYMSPEQATAEKEITARSDIYSVGSVLYEMLTGNPPHVGASAQQIIMKIITETAEPVTKFRKSVPPHVAAAVARSLEKLPADRFESAKAFADALANPGYTHLSFAGAAAGGAQARAKVLTPAFIAMSALAVAATAFAFVGWNRANAPKPVSRVSVFFPDSQGFGAGSLQMRLAISADGRRIVYAGAGATPGTTRLWLWSRDQLRPVPIPGTEGAINPSFSPSGTRVAFITVSPPRALRTVSVLGGPVLTLTDSLVDLGGVSWGEDGYIYYDGHLEGDGVARIREAGGNPEILSRADSATGEFYHLSPSALPDGRGVLVIITRGVARDAAARTFQVGVFDARSGTHKGLLAGVGAVYARSGHLVYVTGEGALMAAPFDLDRLEISGEPTSLADGVSVRRINRTDLAISSDGTLIYSGGTSTEGLRELVWVKRDGTPSAVDPDWSGPLADRPVLSPDGRSVALALRVGGARQVWVKQLDRGPASRVAEVGMLPSWSTDGRMLLFTAATEILRVPADGSAMPAVVRGGGAGAAQYSSDGQWLVIGRRGDFSVARTGGDTTERVLVADKMTQGFGALSPDGRWFAYQSDETGQGQVYVRPFPDAAASKYLVSVRGGVTPRWSRSGRELFYGDAVEDLWSVSVAPGPVFRAGIPTRLFSASRYGPLQSFPFDVSSDGRFLFTRPVGLQTPRPDELIVVENVFAELRAKAPRR